MAHRVTRPVRNLLSTVTLVGLAMVLCGCSTTTGLTLWPSQFPLLPQAKQFAGAAQLPSNLPIEKCKTVLPNYFVEPVMIS